MKKIFGAISLKSQLKNKYVMLFLDYDGTLVPITKTPDKAIIQKATKDLLKQLSKIHNCKLVIISGRDLKDIKKKVGIKNVIYVGNHGFQIQGPKIKFNSPISHGYKTTLKKIKSDLARKVCVVKGAFIEDKELSLSLHYRMVSPCHTSLLKTFFHDVTDCYLANNKIKIKKGKKVLEIRPAVDWNKGEAVLWLLARQQYILKNDKILPIYIGDDVTDEDAFRVLKNEGIGIFVGKPRKSYAGFYLKNPEEVRFFLIQLKEILG